MREPEIYYWMTITRQKRKKNKLHLVVHMHNNCVTHTRTHTTAYTCTPQKHWDVHTMKPNSQNQMLKSWFSNKNYRFWYINWVSFGVRLNYSRTRSDGVSSIPLSFYVRLLEILHNERIVCDTNRSDPKPHLQSKASWNPIHHFLILHLLKDLPIYSNIDEMSKILCWMKRR